MAPAQSKIAPVIVTGQRKRKASSKITDENFVGAERNAVTKCLKLSADADKSRKLQKRQASVEDVEDEDKTPVNHLPKNPSALIEADDGGGNDDAAMLDSDDPAPLEGIEPYGEDNEDDDEELEIIKPETAEAQRGKSIKS
jgi:hypothetical protein